MGYTSSLMDIDWYLDRQSVYKGFRFSPLSNMCIKCGTVLWTAKFGVEPSECVQLAKHVKKECPNLQFSGLMTIGMLDYTSTPENFQTLASCREKVCRELDIPEHECELSMGMSSDFENAVLSLFSLFFATSYGSI
jgi:uncharacterized pyridoxal phosphate-containing UPF0001 family protein